VPITTLRAWPFLLAWGDSVFAKVVAINIKGPSLYSDVGQGGKVETTPDTPISVLKDAANTNNIQVAITWHPGPTFYGSAIIDYTVSYDQGSGSWTVAASNVLTTSYIKTGVATGTAYVFKVQARTEYGLSAYSDTVTVLAGSPPAIPAAPITTVNGLNVEISWTAPNNNGAPIIAYQVLIRKADGLTFAEELTYCDAS
jgi:hypothetical protein